MKPWLVEWLHPRQGWLIAERFETRSQAYESLRCPSEYRRRVRGDFSSSGFFVVGYRTAGLTPTVLATVSTRGEAESLRAEFAAHLEGYERIAVEQSLTDQDGRATTPERTVESERFKAACRRVS